jgi:hypothetical protein
MCCLSLLLLGRYWVQSRGESSVALIKDPQGNPYPERVEEEKIYPSVCMSVSLSFLVSMCILGYYLSGEGSVVENKIRKNNVCRVRLVVKLS